MDRPTRDRPWYRFWIDVERFEPDGRGQIQGESAGTSLEMTDFAASLGINGIGVTPAEQRVVLDLARWAHDVLAGGLRISMEFLAFASDLQNEDGDIPEDLYLDFDEVRAEAAHAALDLLSLPESVEQFITDCGAILPEPGMVPE
jgi:hypothetical protein